MATKEEYWNKVYSENPYKYGKAPSPFLIEMLPRLRQGKTLDLGMGEGAASVFLAQKGFTVKGVDISQVAIDHAQKLASDTGVIIETKKTDLDLFLFGLLEYDSIIMTNFKPPLPRYYSEMIRALKQGGTLLVESHMVEDLTEVIGPEESHRDYYYKSNELIYNLKGMRLLYYNEGHINGKHLVQYVAQKPLDKDASKYQLFDMQSGPKDTGKSAHLKLAEQLFKKKDE